jgi:hypothetical protein
LWNTRNKGIEILANLTEKNEALFEFERMLEGKNIEGSGETLPIEAI